MSPPSKKVAVLGARGRMGAQVCSAVADAGGLELVAELDAGDPLQAIVDAGAEVVVDFTHPDVVMDNLAWCIDHGVDAVVGTSGFTEARLEQLSVMVGESAVAILVVPNFSIGAVLMMRMAEQAAPYFESVEIIELHHPGKVDAPSGTALHTAERIAAAREAVGLGPSPDSTKTSLEGARGAEVAGVR
ncbi:MAG: 4-hydroxy-tetrahydrodipicolinate reductase, partial [Nocardioidaceae bacterium]